MLSKTSLIAGLYIYVLYFLFTALVLRSLNKGSILGLPFFLSLFNFPLTLGFASKYISISRSGLDRRVLILLLLVLIFCSTMSTVSLMFTSVIIVDVEKSSFRNLFSFYGFLLILLVIV